MKKIFLFPFAVAALLAWRSLPAAQGSDNVPAPAPTRAVVLQGGTIHTVSGLDIPDGVLVFDRGKITLVGGHEFLGSVPASAQVIDVRGKHVYPGMIAAHTVLGLTEIPAVRATVDIAETGAVNPDARALVSINPDSELLPVTRSNGVLSALVVPKSQNGLISGLSTLVNLDGWTWEGMCVRPSVGLHVFWPDLRIDRDPRYPKTPEDQQKDIDARLRQLRDTFAVARAYAKELQAVSNPSAGPTGAISARRLETNIRFEAMLPVLRGEMPVFIHANEVKQIEAAVRWAAAEKLKLVLVGAQDAWRVAALLKERDVSVIVGGVNALPQRRGDSFDEPYANAGKLATAGVRFCIASDGSDFEAAHERNLPYQAAQAAAHGLARDEALKSVTLYPALILGVADRLGSLEPGKDANVIITSGDPLEISTQVEAAWIAGRPVDLSNKQTRLFDKYRRKYGM